MPVIRHKINGGLATASEASVEKLVATGHWELVKDPKPVTKKTTAPRKPRKAAEPKETSDEE